MGGAVLDRKLEMNPNAKHSINLGVDKKVGLGCAGVNRDRMELAFKNKK